MAQRLIKKFKEKKPFVIYPDTPFKMNWDYFMTL